MLDKTKNTNIENISDLMINDEYSIIALDKFIQATRDSGYKGTASAVSELVDNAVQAGAKTININIEDSENDSRYPFIISVIDDGCGMNVQTLRQALRFGGSSRFNDRSGLGRYGMGLPNSSFSQAKRVEVYTRQEMGDIYWSYLDLNEITSGQLTKVPQPQILLSDDYLKYIPRSGTMVKWINCDRLDNRRISTIARKLSSFIGKTFRHIIWDGVAIKINGHQIRPIDPLFLNDDSYLSGAACYGGPYKYEIEINSSNGVSSIIGRVKILFSELPVLEWHNLPNAEKRKYGITKGGGISVVRAGREIDYGWFFMGLKRKENYDDWWRCEVQFDPILDEHFGITHTKQQIHPTSYLNSILSPDMEAIGRALSGRVRNAHLKAKSRIRFSESEKRISEMDEKLRPLPKAEPDRDKLKIADEMFQKYPDLKPNDNDNDKEGFEYKIVEEPFKNTRFYDFFSYKGQFVLAINPEHPFYKKIYKPLCEADADFVKILRGQIELLLMAAARSEALSTDKEEKQITASFVNDWSDTISKLIK